MNRNPVIYLKFKNRYNRCYHEHPWVNVGRIANVTDLRVEKPAKPTVEQRLKISMPLGKVQGESRFDNYIIRQDLGYGANGVVKEGLVPLNKPGTYLAIAIKTCRLDSSNTENNEYILREVAIMNRMRHKRIIKIYEVCLIGTQAKLAIELMACSIGRLISIMEPMKENMAMRIIRDALEGLAYLHSKNYIHRDVKCDNIMIDWGGVVKLGDFGLAIPFNKSKRGVAGTVRWMAPEVVGKEAYDSRADIWSLGISIIEMMDCLPPYGDEHENSKKIEERIIRGPTPFFTTFEPTTSMKHITNMMLTRSRLERPSAKELLRVSVSRY
ncbi:kinase-like domain-containing protein [Phycomyces nitens]|nr:kinase-like domain-containing protein [Phycomyces nitens]